MIVLGKIIDPKRSNKAKPQDNYRCKRCSQLFYSERLDRIQENQNSTSGPDNGALASVSVSGCTSYTFGLYVGDIGSDNVQPLNSTQNRLSRSQDAV